MEVAIIIINCVCTVLAIIITMAKMHSAFVKTNLTKEDLAPITKKLESMEHKMDTMSKDQSSMKERMAVVEYKLGIHHLVGGEVYDDGH